MKLPLFPLLCASLAFNATFALVFGLGSRPVAPPAPTPSVEPAKPAPPPLTPEIWPALQTDELPSLIARLRESGFPPDLIRAIVAAQISDLFATRRKALAPAVERLPFWKNAPPDPKNDAALRQLRREQDKMLRELFGDVPDPTSDLYLTQQGGKLDFLAPAKADEIRRLLRDYNDRRSDIHAEGTYETNREKLAALETAQHDAIARLLSPTELLDYDLRNSNASRTLRESLSAFDPTEAEFRALFEVRRSFDERYSGASGFIALNPEQTRAREAAEKQLKAQIATLLSPERAAAYERATDYSFRETNKLVARLALPPETAVNLWNTQKDYERRSREISPTTPPEQRSAQLTALKTETLAKLTPLLGPTLTLDLYRQYGGYWIDQLKPSLPAKK